MTSWAEQKDVVVIGSGLAGLAAAIEAAKAGASVVVLEKMKVIPGLFAAGEVCGGIHGASRVGKVVAP